jgi:hypothetical protein
MLQSVFEGKQVLTRFASSTDDLSLNNDNRAIILDTNGIGFWNNLKIVINILEPIIQSIKLLEKDNSNISEVPVVFNSIKNRVQELNLGDLIDINEVYKKLVEN